MSCDEIRERLVDLLYDEPGAAAADVREHLVGCDACRQELEDLERTREVLRRWEDEPPARPVVVPGHGPTGWKYLKYAAVAAMAVVCILALANTQLSWNRGGFSLKTRLFGNAGPTQDYYTKSEIRNLVKEALDDSEKRTNETNYLMMQRMLETVEQDRYMDLRLSRARSGQSRVRN